MKKLLHLFTAQSFSVAHLSVATLISILMRESSLWWALAVFPAACLTGWLAWVAERDA